MTRRFKKGLIRKLIKLSAFLVCIIVLSALHIRFNVNPVIKKISEEEVRAYVNTVVNESASTIMSSAAVDYNDIIEIVKNNNGDVSMIKAKPIAVNSLARSVTLLTQTKLQNYNDKTVSIPIGTLSGLTFLSGKGFNVDFTAIPVGSATTNFVSSFTSTGINQTLHRIYMEIKANVNVIVPGMDITVDTVTDVLIAETIIVGNVPDTYFDSSLLSQMLNLIP